MYILQDTRPCCYRWVRCLDFAWIPQHIFQRSYFACLSLKHFGTPVIIICGYINTPLATYSFEMGSSSFRSYLVTTPWLPVLFGINPLHSLVGTMLIHTITTALMRGPMIGLFSVWTVPVYSYAVSLTGLFLSIPWPDRFNGGSVLGLF